jgi:phthiodiolone/phenolphthiodiolone dimycocerosates ketoreductase
MTRPLRIAYPYDNHRSTPIAAAGPFANAIQQSPIDFCWLWDEFAGWFPGDLWSTKNTPAADLVDVNSLSDPFVLAAFAIAANPKANIRLTTDAVRNGPAGLLRQVLTLASGTAGQVVTAIGAGEIRQMRPFGYKRSEGLARLEDMFILLNKLLDEKDPFTYEGKHWNFKQATIGAARPLQRPEFWALGGGPVLLDIAARYADGFEAAVPNAIPTVDEFGETVEEVRKKVESYDRDPEKFGFGAWIGCVMHEDPEVIEKVLANPIIKFYAGILGRLNGAQWEAEGISSVMPVGWHYAIKWLPFEQTNAEVADIVSKVTPEMTHKSVYHGSPAEIAKVCQRYIDVGASMIGFLDMTALALGGNEGAESLRRAMEVATILKGAAVR